MFTPRKKKKEKDILYSRENLLGRRFMVAGYSQVFTFRSAQGILRDCGMTAFQEESDKDPGSYYSLKDIRKKIKSKIWLIIK